MATLRVLAASGFLCAICFQKGVWSAEARTEAATCLHHSVTTDKAGKIAWYKKRHVGSGSSCAVELVSSPTSYVSRWRRGVDCVAMLSWSLHFEDSSRYQAVMAPRGLHNLTCGRRCSICFLPRSIMHFGTISEEKSRNCSHKPLLSSSNDNRQHPTAQWNSEMERPPEPQGHDADWMVMSQLGQRRLLQTTTQAVSTAAVEASLSSNSGDFGIGIMTGIFIALGVVGAIIGYIQREAVRSCIGQVRSRVRPGDAGAPIQREATEVEKSVAMKTPRSVKGQLSLPDVRRPSEMAHSAFALSDISPKPVSRMEHGSPSSNSLYFAVGSPDVKAASPSLYGNVKTPSNVDNDSLQYSMPFDFNSANLQPESGGAPIPQGRVCDLISKFSDTTASNSHKAQSIAIQENEGDESQGHTQPITWDDATMCGATATGKFESDQICTRVDETLPSLATDCDTSNLDLTSQFAHEQDATSCYEIEMERPPSLPMDEDKAISELIQDPDSLYQDCSNFSALHGEAEEQFSVESTSEMAAKSNQAVSTEPAYLMKPPVPGNRDAYTQESEAPDCTDDIIRSQEAFSYDSGGARLRNASLTAGKTASWAKARFHFGMKRNKDDRSGKPTRFRDVLSQLMKTVSSKQLSDFGENSRIKSMQRVASDADIMGLAIPRPRSASFPFTGSNTFQLPGMDPKASVVPVLRANRYTGPVQPTITLDREAEEAIYSPIQAELPEKPQRRRTLSIPSRSGLHRRSQASPPADTMSLGQARSDDANSAGACRSPVKPPRRTGSHHLTGGKSPSRSKLHAIVSAPLPDASLVPTSNTPSFHMQHEEVSTSGRTSAGGGTGSDEGDVYVDMSASASLGPSPKLTTATLPNPPAESSQQLYDTAEQVHDDDLYATAQPLSFPGNATEDMYMDMSATLSNESQQADLS